MKQKLIALTIASLLAAPAFADDASIKLYGKAFLTLDRYDSGVAGATSQTRVNTNASRLGVKGEKELTDGLAAVYQFEVEMDADGGKNTGLGRSTRNSGLGLKGNFGTVILGKWDSPFKVAHNAIELFDNTTNWSAIKTIGISEKTDYNTRQKNMVQYWTPKMNGLQASLLYSPDESQTPTVNKSIFSLAATYKQDAIYAAAAYESRKDQTTVGTTDNALRLVGRYDFDGAWLGAMYERIKTNTTAATSVTGNNGELVGGIKLGESSIALSYAKAGSTAIAPAAANDVKQTTLKYAYNFNKNAQLFAAYTSMKTNGTISETANTLGGGFIYSF